MGLAFTLNAILKEPINAVPFLDNCWELSRTKDLFSEYRWSGYTDVVKWTVNEATVANGVLMLVGSLQVVYDSPSVHTSAFYQILLEDGTTSATGTPLQPNEMTDGFFACCLVDYLDQPEYWHVIPTRSPLEVAGTSLAMADSCSVETGGTGNNVPGLYGLAVDGRRTESMFTVNNIIGKLAPKQPFFVNTCGSQLVQNPVGTTDAFRRLNAYNKRMPLPDAALWPGDNGGLEMATQYNFLVIPVEDQGTPQNPDAGAPIDNVSDYTNQIGSYFDTANWLNLYGMTMRDEGSAFPSGSPFYQTGGMAYCMNWSYGVQGSTLSIIDQITSLAAGKFRWGVWGGLCVIGMEQVTCNGNLAGTTMLKQGAGGGDDAYQQTIGEGQFLIRASHDIYTIPSYSTPWDNIPGPVSGDPEWVTGRPPVWNTSVFNTDNWAYGPSTGVYASHGYAYLNRYYGFYPRKWSSIAIQPDAPTTYNSMGIGLTCLGGSSWQTDPNQIPLLTSTLPPNTEDYLFWPDTLKLDGSDEPITYATFASGQIGSFNDYNDPLTPDQQYPAAVFRLGQSLWNWSVESTAAARQSLEESAIAVVQQTATIPTLNWPIILGVNTTKTNDGTDQWAGEIYGTNSFHLGQNYSQWPDRYYGPGIDLYRPVIGPVATRGGQWETDTSILLPAVWYCQINQPRIFTLAEDDLGLYAMNWPQYGAEPLTFNSWSPDGRTVLDATAYGGEAPGTSNLRAFGLGGLYARSYPGSQADGRPSALLYDQGFETYDADLDSTNITHRGVRIWRGQENSHGAAAYPVGAINQIPTTLSCEISHFRVVPDNVCGGMEVDLVAFAAPGGWPGSWTDWTFTGLTDMCSKITTNLGYLNTAYGGAGQALENNTFTDWILEPDPQGIGIFIKAPPIGGDLFTGCPLTGQTDGVSMTITPSGGNFTDIDYYSDGISPPNGPYFSDLCAGMVFHAGETINTGGCYNDWGSDIAAAIEPIPGGTAPATTGFGVFNATFDVDRPQWLITLWNPTLEYRVMSINPPWGTILDQTKTFLNGGSITPAGGYIDAINKTSELDATLVAGGPDTVFATAPWITDPVPYTTQVCQTMPVDDSGLIASHQVWKISGTTGRTCRVWINYILYDGLDSLVAVKLLDLGLRVTIENVEWYKAKLINQGDLGITSEEIENWLASQRQQYTDMLKEKERQGRLRRRRRQVEAWRESLGDSLSGDWIDTSVYDLDEETIEELLQEIKKLPPAKEEDDGPFYD
jgi:hypothetical protein